MTPSAMPNRALVRQPNGPLRPDTLGNRLASGTTTPSITTSPVIEARNDNLPPIFGAERPFMPFSRMKPRISSPWAADFSQMTNTSASGALEIQVLLPLRR